MFKSELQRCLLKFAFFILVPKVIADPELNKFGLCA